MLANYAVLAAGFDAPKVRALYVARPTYAPNAYQQMIGRGLRGPLNGGTERCLLVNVADNVERFEHRLAFHEFDYLWDPDRRTAQDDPDPGGMPKPDPGEARAGSSRRDRTARLQVRKVTLLVSTELSPAQRTIVEAPADQRLLVLAAAGTGKTHVLVERIRRLVTEGDLAPGRELLVLSFTRSAVGELRRRIGSAGGRATLVRPITFDSFATAVLASLRIPRRTGVNSATTGE